MTCSSIRIKLKLLTVLVTLLSALHSASAQDQPWSQNTSPLPAPTGFVNDIAGVIDSSTEQQLEKKLKDLRDTTDPSVEIAVVTVDTTGERDIFDYSLAVARGWGIGSKEDDNPGALLLVAVKDRKYFTQISRNLEDELPDGIAGSLQRQYLVPEFRKGNYGKGISDTIDAYIATIRKTNLPAAAKDVPSGGRTESVGGGSGLFCCAVIGLILLILLFSRSKGGPSKNDRDRWGGGGFGGGGGGGVGGALPWIIGSIIASSTSGGSSSSSGWGGSSSDWGGSSGGFGGFGGGGDFGGGGAGGDW
jgi:uncharacterized protein